MNVFINNHLFERLTAHRHNTSFKKTEELVEYILDEYLIHLKQKHNSSDNKSDKDILNERLKNLGYL